MEPPAPVVETTLHLVGGHPVILREIIRQTAGVLVAITLSAAMVVLLFCL